MKKYIYKDEPYYVYIYENTKYCQIGSVIRIYVKRTNIFRFIKKYKCVIARENESNYYVTLRKTLLDLLEQAHVHQHENIETVVECIECSPEIKELYNLR
jgi:hypothetical protein